MSVAGTGIPLGTTVLSNDSSTQITLSAQVTLSQGTALDFTSSAGFTGKDVLLSEDGSLAYMIHNAGLNIIEISDPSAVTEKGSWLETTGAEAAVLTSTGDYIILNSGEVINITDVDQPVFEGSIGGSWIAAEVLGDKLFTVSAVGDLTIYDISSPVSPVSVSTYPTGGSAKDLSVVGSKLYVTDDVNVTATTANSPSNASSIELDDTAGIEAGMSVTGTGIPSGTTVIR